MIGWLLHAPKHGTGPKKYVHKKKNRDRRDPDARPVLRAVMQPHSSPYLNRVPSTEFPFGLREGEADEWVPLYYDVRLHNSTGLWERKRIVNTATSFRAPRGSIEFEVGLGRKAADVTMGTPYNSKRWAQ